MSDSDYKPATLKAPRASGTKLKILTAVVENSLTGAMLGGTLLKSAGVLDMRAAVATDPHPLRPPQPETLPERLADRLPEGDLYVLTATPREETFPFVGVKDYLEAYRSRRITPEEVARRVLSATRDSEGMSPPMRFFIAQREDDVLEQALASTRRWEKGETLGPLDGVPVAVKDELDQVGYPSTVGTCFLGQKPAERDAEVVGRLRAGGAVLIGKANMHEIGLGVTGMNPHHGPVRNPYDPGRATGGSSSGPAALVASGMCPIAVGADGGGSIRIPASLCGMVGLKPTFGRLSERGVAPLCWSLAHVGPIAASARDAALAYGLMAGPDPEDDHTWSQPAPHLSNLAQGDLSDLTLGIFEPWFNHAAPAVVAACRQVLDQLVARGARVLPVSLPEVNLVRTVHMTTIVSEMAASQMAYYAEHRADYGYDVRINLKLASKLTAADYIHAQRLRVRLNRHFFEALKTVDVIVTPTTGCTAPEIPPSAVDTGESNLTLLETIMRFAPIGNLTGLPAISFPAGYDDSGLPIGIQAIGRLWEEHTLLRLALVAESFVSRRMPKVHFQILD